MELTQLVAFKYSSVFSIFLHYVHYGKSPFHGLCSRDVHGKWEELEVGRVGIGSIFHHKSSYIKLNFDFVTLNLLIINPN